MQQAPEQAPEQAPVQEQAPKQTAESSQGERPTAKIFGWFCLAATLPFSLFVAIHILTYGGKNHGRSLLERAAPPSFAFTVFEACFIWLPLTLFTAYGVWLGLARAPAPLARQGTSRAWARRAASLACVAFIAFHLVHLGWPAPEQSELFSRLCASLSSTTDWSLPLSALIYLSGTLIALLELRFGVVDAVRRLGLLTSSPAEQRLERVATLLVALLFLTAANTVVYFATGTDLFFWVLA